MSPPIALLNGTARLDSLRPVTRFGFVGASGAVVNLTTLFVFHGWLKLPLLVGVPVAVEIAVLNNFFWNNQWTFAGRSVAQYGFLKFNLGCLFGLMLCALAVHVLVSSFAIHYLIADVAGIILAAGSNFFFSNAWAWKREPLA